MSQPNAWQLVAVDGDYGLLRDGLFFYPIGDAAALEALRQALRRGAIPIPALGLLPDRSVSVGEAARIAQERRPDRYGAAPLARVTDTLRQAVRAGHIVSSKSVTGRHVIQLSSLITWLDQRPNREKGVQ